MEEANSHMVDRKETTTTKEMRVLSDMAITIIKIETKEDLRNIVEGSITSTKKGETEATDRTTSAIMRNEITNPPKSQVDLEGHREAVVIKVRARSHVKI